MKRIRTIEKDGDCWVARSPHTGKEYPEEGFRWFSRAAARAAVCEAQALDAPGCRPDGEDGGKGGAA